jgi:hypothetical protein
LCVSLIENGVNPEALAVRFPDKTDNGEKRIADINYEKGGYQRTPTRGTRFGRTVRVTIARQTCMKYAWVWNHSKC